jgi:hypothetical protein
MGLSRALCYWRPRVMGAHTRLGWTRARGAGLLGEGSAAYWQLGPVHGSGGITMQLLRITVTAGYTVDAVPPVIAPFDRPPSPAEFEAIGRTKAPAAAWFSNSF